MSFSLYIAALAVTDTITLIAGEFSDFFFKYDGQQLSFCSRASDAHVLDSLSFLFPVPKPGWAV